MKRLPTACKTISDLDGFHRWMDQLFEAHQIALMKNEPQQAVTILSRLTERMSIHVRDEEELLLPLYEQKINPVPAGGAAEFYRREHEQIMGFLKRFHEHQPAGRDEISLVHYFDMCTMYKDLIEHHHARERTFLYRLLDRKLTAAEKKHILKIFTGHQDHAD
jgi:iron-sulfur cluster repair protein YtfE (RIC family)